MVNTDRKEGGIHAWMTSVRASMASDPCRQLFEDQVQTHAFIFLDDYLEHILAGPKQGPIIELVKTPGRRKNIPRRTRAATAAAAKLKSASLFSLDSDNSVDDAVPVNSFHKALLQAKQRPAQDALDSQKRSTSLPSTSNGSTDEILEHSKFLQVVEIPGVSVSTEPESQAGMMPLQHCFGDPPGEPTAAFLPVECRAELSIIAEGDESPERTHANINSSIIVSDRDELPLEVAPSCREARALPTAEGDPEIIRTNVSRRNASPDPQCSLPSSVNTLRSIPLNSSQAVQSSETSARHHTEPLPSWTVIHSLGNHERNVFTAPLPTGPAPKLVSIPHTISVPLNDLSPRALAHKSGAASFPTLPAPSPLRKSMHITPEAVIGPAPPSAMPVVVPLGKRTSWLMKAREAKAKEGTGSLHGKFVTTAAIPRGSTAVKRKSEEILDAIPAGPDWEDQRKPKVAKSTEVDIVAPVSKETEKTSSRDFPSVQGEPTAPSSISTAIPVDLLQSHAEYVDRQVAYADPTEEGFIDLFKRTVEGFGARTSKSTGKSLGGAAVVALAEARAAAEAKVAERNKVNSMSSDTEVVHDGGLPDLESHDARAQLDDPSLFVLASRAEGTESRLSLSDLAPSTVQSNKFALSTRTAKPVDVGTHINSGDKSISATPPDSPPLKGTFSFVKPAGPVFNKPPPPSVFMPPAPKQSSIGPHHLKEFPPNFPLGQSTSPVAVSLGIPARLASPSRSFLPRVQGTAQVSLQPLQSSILPGSTFEERKGALVWIPPMHNTQDILQDTIDSQSRDAHGTATIDDDDDSWPLEEKLAAVEPGWRPFDFSNIDKEDTWSSLPTESQGPTRSLAEKKNSDMVPLPSEMDIDVKTNNEDVEPGPDPIEVSDDERSIMEVSEPEAATVVTTSPGRAQATTKGRNQTSMASTTSSSQSQAGFFGQATKLVNSMLGGGKKAKPELKSLQLAAAVAKKQQEEAGKKTQRLKDMEARRQAAVTKKVEEERTRLLEEEKKNKEELERRKREREENTDRRPPKPPVSTKKGEDDTSKKRKLAPDTEKKPPSKDRKDFAPTVTPATKLASQKGVKATTTALVSSAVYNATQNVPPAPSAKPIIPEAKPFKVVSSSLKGKAKAKPQEDDIGDKLPSTMVQSQMAARAKAQMQAAKLPTPEIPSESIELPDINSEYSDSEDENRVRTFDPPDWAQSPELRQALQMQSTLNPDNIFGSIRPLRMEEMFRTRQSRFRARTSSANWSGSDRLTVEEIRSYERRMGFQ